MDLFHLRRHRHLSLHSRLVLIITSILLIVGTGVFYCWSTTIRILWALKVSARNCSTPGLGLRSPRTAGFNTVALGQLRQATLFFVIILMFIGASPGSTGGGIKTTTFGIAVTSLWGLITGKDSLVVFKRTPAHYRFNKGLLCHLRRPDLDHSGNVYPHPHRKREAFCRCCSK